MALALHACPGSPDDLMSATQPGSERLRQMVNPSGFG
jgi:hypothetical protein